MILNRPYTFDIVVSEFGREAAIRFAELVATYERRIIQHQFEDPNTPFFDEYRRIMFVILGDLGYFKRTEIEKYIPKDKLDSQILIGIGDKHVPSNIEKRMFDSIVEQIHYASSRGYKSIRVVIPCNTLSELGFNLDQLLSDRKKLIRLMCDTLGISDELNLEEMLREVKFQVCTVPSVVLDVLCLEKGPNLNLLLLGTELSLENYQMEIDRRKLTPNLRILKMNKQEQLLVDNAVVASINGDVSVVREVSSKILNNIILPRKDRNDNLHIVEACTDFTLSLGVNSLDVFAKKLVYDVYEVKYPILDQVG